MKRTFILILGLLLISFVSAQPPFQQTTIVNEGIQIEFPKFEYLEIGESFQLNVHPFNASNGLRLYNDTTDCELHGFYKNGTHAIITPLDFNLNNSDFFIDIPADFFVGGKGSYIIYCNTSDIGGFVSGPIYITHTGFELKIEVAIIDIALLLFFIGLLIGFYYIRQKIDFKKWYNGILEKYKDRNFVKMVLSGLAFNIVEKSFIIYYLIGFPIMLMVTNLASTYNIVAIIDLMKVLMYIYAWGFILVGVVFLSYVQEWAMDLIELIKKMDWGLND